jgi:hypothetical protein
MTNAKPMPSAIAASSSPSQIWKRLRALVLFNIRSRAARPRAGRATAPRPSAWWDELRIQLIAGTGMALLFAGLAPALVMAALWHTAEIAPFIFTFAACCSARTRVATMRKAGSAGAIVCFTILNRGAVMRQRRDSLS